MTSTDTPQEPLSDTDLLTEIAILYYQEGTTQEEISHKFNLSRAKIDRMLRKSREEGIFEARLKDGIIGDIGGFNFLNVMEITQIQ